MLETILFFIFIGSILFWIQSGGLKSIHRFLTKIANTNALYFGLALLCVALFYSLFSNGEMQITGGMVNGFHNNMADLAQSLKKISIIAGVCLVIYAFAEKLTLTIIKVYKNKQSD